MTFQAYIDNATAKTGKTPEQLKAEAEKAGVYSYDMKASELTKFLKDEFGLRHGHSMAVWLVFKQEGWVADPKNKKQI